MPILKPKSARPMRPYNTMQQAGTTAVEVIVEERSSILKEDVMRLVEAQISGCVDLSPEEMVDAAFLIVERIDDKLDVKKE